MIRFLYILLLFPIFLNAQEYKFEANCNKNSLIVGEPAKVEVKLNIPAEQSIDTVFFKLSGNGDTLGNNWELWNTSEIVKESIQTEDDDYYINYSQEFTIANFDTGKYEFPPVVAILDSTTLFSNSLLFNVSYQSINQEESIKSIKPIKEVYISWWEYLIHFFYKYGLIILLIIFSVFIMIIIIKKFKKSTEQEYEIPKIPLEIILLEKLEKIKKNKFWENGDFKTYYSKITEINWLFLEHRYQIQTFEKTSDEILKSLKWSSIPENFFSELSRLFEISDGVKFAKLQPLEKDNIHAFNITKTLIQEERTDLKKENNNE